MLKKIIFVASIGLIFLSFAGCSKQQNSGIVDMTTAEVTTTEVKNEIPISKPVKMPIFDHPLGWQILSMTDIDLIQGYKDAAKETFGTNVLGYRSTEINFDKPHDIGPYDRTVDIQIQDFIFETSPATSEEYLAKIESAWGEKGKTENYTAPTGLDFVVWLGQSPTYETDLVLYVAKYSDNDGQKHFVEISRMGTGQEEIKSALKPVIDSFKYIQPENRATYEEWTYAAEIKNIVTNEDTAILSIDTLEHNPDFLPGFSGPFLNKSEELKEVIIDERTRAYHCGAGADNEDTTPDIFVSNSEIMDEIKQWLSNGDVLNYYFDVENNFVKNMYQMCLP